MLATRTSWLLAAFLTSLAACAPPPEASDENPATADPSAKPAGRLIRTEVLRERFDDLVVESRRSTDGKSFETTVLDHDGKATLATQKWDLASGAIALSPQDGSLPKMTAQATERASLTAANRRARAMLGSAPRAQSSDDSCYCAIAAQECIPETTCQTPCSLSQICYDGGIQCDFPAPDCDPAYGDCGVMYCFEAPPICDPPTVTCYPTVCETVQDCQPLCIDWVCSQSS